MSAERQPPISDYAMVGDCRTAALVSRRGSIDWCCLPRFDSGSSFGRLLDCERGGSWELAPGGEAEPTRRYLSGSLVLSTSWSSGGAMAEVTDAMVTTGGDSFAARAGGRTSEYRPDERRLVRVIDGIRGELDFETRLAPRFDYGQVSPWLRREGTDIWSAIGGDDGLLIQADAELAPNRDRDRLESSFTVRAGERVRFSLLFRRPERIDEDSSAIDAEELDRALAETIGSWRRWGESLDTGAVEEPGVRRSAEVLRALAYEPTGAIVAAATTALPEAVGGPRNWDYRYSWIRDSSFASRTLSEVGAAGVADSFRRFIERSAAGRAEELQIVYGIGGERRLVEVEIDGIAGYRDSLPVQIGNSASNQTQLDAIGELVNVSWRWHRRGHSPDDDDWRFLASLIDTAAECWSEPDRGIWEWRAGPEHFVHSKALCWSALELGVKLAEECLREAPTRRWSRARDEIREAIEERGYDAGRGVFVQTFDRSELDAALLLLPHTGFVAWDDPRMIRTADLIRDELDAGDGLIYRYRRDDGLAGDEGAFVACGFWLAECFARQRRPEEARTVFDSALATANDLGLFSEQWDPGAGEMRGNFPQALSHLAHIAAALAIEAGR